MLKAEQGLTSQSRLLDLRWTKPLLPRGRPRRPPPAGNSSPSDCRCSRPIGAPPVASPLRTPRSQSDSPSTAIGSELSSTLSCLASRPRLRPGTTPSICTESTQVETAETNDGVGEAWGRGITGTGGLDCALGVVPGGASGLAWLAVTVCPAFSGFPSAMSVVAALATLVSVSGALSA